MIRAIINIIFSTIRYIFSVGANIVAFLFLLAYMLIFGFGIAVFIGVILLGIYSLLIL